MLIDTGSSNTWVGAQTFTNPFTPSLTTQRTGQLVVCGISYGFYPPAQNDLTGIWNCSPLRMVQVSSLVWPKNNMFKACSLIRGFLGQEFVDTVTLANGLAIKNQSFGSALLSQGFDDVDGIIGCVWLSCFSLSPYSNCLPLSIGPVDLTCGKFDVGQNSW